MGHMKIYWEKENSLYSIYNQLRLWHVILKKNKNNVQHMAAQNKRKQKANEDNGINLISSLTIFMFKRHNITTIAKESYTIKHLNWFHNWSVLDSTKIIFILFLLFKIIHFISHQIMGQSAATTLYNILLRNLQNLLSKSPLPYMCISVCMIPLLYFQFGKSGPISEVEQKKQRLQCMSTL